MNNDRQNCPYLPDLMRNHDLQRKLEQEQNRRIEAEMRNKPLFAAGFLLLVILAIGVTFCFVCGNMDTEVLSACAHLTCACAALFASLGFALLAVNITLDCWVKRKKEKDAAKKKEV